jgi:NADH-quinone oxidoreductase subunit I
MGAVLKKVELGWTDRTYIWPIAKGLLITIKHFFKQLTAPTSKRRTIQYPEMKRTVPEGYRGLHCMKRHDDGSIKCVACFLCAEACPSRCISIEAEEIGDIGTMQGILEKRPASFKIDLLRCIFCGMCSEACPKDAICLSGAYELTSGSRHGPLAGDYDLLNEPIRPNCPQESTHPQTAGVPKCS